MIAKEEFHSAIMLERKRTERTRKPFLLMLVDMGGRSPFEKAELALSGFTGEADVTGWYKNYSVLGAIFRDFEPDDRNTILGAMMTKVSDTLRQNLSEHQFSEMQISFHLFPEEWNH